MKQLVDRYDKAVSLLMRTLWPEMTQFKEFGLTMPQFSLLRMIHKIGDAKITDLAETMEVKPSAITVMIDRLEAGGFVERRHGEKDRRVVRVSITKDGESILEKAQEKSKQVLAKYFAGLEPEELEQLVTINEKLAVIAENIKKASETREEMESCCTHE
ncbi:MarR family transcriptional regulator [Paenibacillus aurantius]|uniref:MarR family transcriptional regulator n=1 Tax=Paenibacillus aurantius TaxID=2918900 RepID=A0AA96RCC8_9BACL|nr:MarR family transcriptional regulator [Paenibacillus aurantius]WNQ10390.1 MarR family transcriptional regulator [Paenibacillus aurantius]